MGAAVQNVFASVQGCMGVPLGCHRVPGCLSRGCITSAQGCQAVLSRNEFVITGTEEYVPSRL